MMNIELLWQGLEVTLFGLLGVFGVLIAFYILVILLGKIPEREESEAEN
jgi:Na+-transporting methylmalonyl-CoA/oxaloacetate decarboxylase gamma subunit